MVGLQIERLQHSCSNRDQKHMEITDDRDIFCQFRQNKCFIVQIGIIVNIVAQVANIVSTLTFLMVGTRVFATPIIDVAFGGLMTDRTQPFSLLVIVISQSALTIAILIYVSERG